MRKQEHIQRLVSGADFIWATGIEDTFIADPWHRTGRTLDEYELTGHYERWEEDLRLMASLGVRYARYGIPWYKINPQANEWNWEWADKPLERLLELDIQPIVDLVHYGVPAWIANGFAGSEYPDRVAEYAGRIADRFRGRIRWYTPLNEPRITAWYCGKIGWWPPYLRGWPGFVQVMIGICKGIVLTAQVLKSVDPEIRQVHVDATDLYIPRTNDAVKAAELRSEIVFLALDLVVGRIDDRHLLHSWLTANGASHSDLDWFAEHAVIPDIVGLNMYPMFSQKELSVRNGRLRVHMRYAGAEIAAILCKMYHERYKLPIIIAETASKGSVARRRKWLSQSVASIEMARRERCPIVGYTWWPMLGLVTWAYRQAARKELSEYLLDMGLWDFAKAGPDPLKRIETPLADDFRKLVSATGQIGGMR